MSYSQINTVCQATFLGDNALMKKVIIKIRRWLLTSGCHQPTGISLVGDIIS